MSTTKVRQEQIKSSAATDGQVLTADGAGNASFEDLPSGLSLTVEEIDGAPSVPNVNKIKVTNGKLTDDGGGVVTVDVSGGGGSGSVAADTIWDAKGDLAVGTGADTAAKLSAGSNGQVPVYASGETTGVKPAVPQPQIVTAYASASDAHTANNTWEDVNSMSVSITPPFASAKLLCEFTVRMKTVSANWDHFELRFDLDTASQSESWSEAVDANAASTRYWVRTVHTVFSGVSAAAHTIKVQWKSDSNLDCTFYDRRLTVMACQ